MKLARLGAWCHDHLDPRRRDAARVSTVEEGRPGSHEADTRAPDQHRRSRWHPAAYLRKGHHLPATRPERTAAPPRTSQDAGLRPRRGRQLAAIALCALSCVLCVASVGARWLRGGILDTHRYLDSVAPLVDNPVIQEAVATQVAQAISKQLARQAQDNLPDPIADILAGPVSGGVEKAVYQITLSFVRGDAFDTIWTEANRTAHQQLVAVLEDRPGSLVAVDDHGVLTIELNPVIVTLAHQLADFGVAEEQLASLSVTMPVTTISDIGRARLAARWLSRAAFWLPPLAVATMVGAVLSAVNRRRMLVVVGLGVSTTMAVLWTVLWIWLPTTVTEGVSDYQLRKAATAVVDQLTGPLLDEIRTTAVAGLVIAAAGTALLVARHRPRFTAHPARPPEADPRP